MIMVTTLTLIITIKRSIAITITMSYKHEHSYNHKHRSKQGFYRIIFSENYAKSVRSLGFNINNTSGALHKQIDRFIKVFPHVPISLAVFDI